MSRTKTLKVGLAGVAALLMLSACQTVTPDDLSRVESEVADLRARLDAADASAARATAAAAQCTETCEANTARVDRMFQESLRK
jgi:Alanine-zipper, major outer membrane lipoprotein